jgi:hypothetical protein
VIGDYMLVNGEQIPKAKAMELIRMLCNDAKELAGQFYELERSEKFRANWINPYVYANCNWRHFVEAVRACYGRLLGMEDIPEYDKHRMFLAIALYDQVAKVSPDFEGIQLAPGSQQFEGDRYENKRITESYGRHSNTFKELLMGSTRYH